MKKFSIIIALIAGSMAFAACGGSEVKEDSPKAKEAPASPAPAKPAKLVVNTEKAQPEQSIIVFDASTSMKGYVDATVPGKFTEVIPVISNAGKNGGTAYLYDTKQTPVDNFLSKIQHRNVKWASESDLFGMIKEIFNKAMANPQNSYALISDGIMSGSNAEIKADPSYNLKPGILQGRIDSIVQHMPQGKDVSLVVAAFDAPFNGTYYEYDNGKKTLVNKNRPFYVLVAAGTAQANHMANLLNEKGGDVVQYGNIYPMNISTNAKLAKGYYIYDKSVKNKGEGLTMTLKLAELPAYAQTLPYLKKNLEVVKTGSKSASKTLSLNDGDYTIEVKGNKATIDFDQKIINTLPATFTFRLKREQPVWVADRHTSNDKTSYSPNTTLNLSNFLAPFVKLNGAQYLNDVEKSTIEIKKQ